MKILKSNAFKRFKKEIGQANHFLITILVGLDGVRSGKVTKNNEFDVAWNPIDPIASAKRSRIYVIKSSLAWTVDCLDMYLSLCNRSPKLFDSKLSKQFDEIGHSVYRKYKLVSVEYLVDDFDKAVVDLLICWRNKMIHFDADNDISKESRNILKMNSSEDKSVNSTHLDVSQMLLSFDKGECPKFKEMAFMIRKTISFVESIDKVLLAKVDTLSFLESVLKKEFKEKDQLFESIFRTVGEKRKQKIMQLICTCGFVEIENNDENVNMFIDNITTISYKEAKDKLLALN